MEWEPLIISQSFYDRDPIIVAQDLLGKFLIRKINGNFLVGKITETEAYLSSGDSAAHNFKGKTKRNESLYKNGGHAYVHSMRQYCLIDVVTESSDKPGSVLIRAVDPVEGIDMMKKHRNEENDDNLTNGPGKVCAAFNITRQLDGIDLTDFRGGLFISSSEDRLPEKITISSRIGISTAKDMPLRFYLSESAHVSKKR